MENLATWSQQTIEAAREGLPWFISICEQIYASPLFRLACYLLLVLVTIWAIAKIYGGELHNAERGPVSIRRHSNTGITADTIVVPRTLIPLTMDGVHAKCTFYYVYEGPGRKRQHAKLFARDMRISVSTSVLRPLTDIAKGNEVPDVETRDVCWPTLDIEEEAPMFGEATPDRAPDYCVQRRVLERWTGDDSLQLISLGEAVMKDVREKRLEFINERVAKLRAAREGNFLARMGARAAALRRPGAVGNYFVRFQFSSDPAFVLSKHPDRDVRMTAWLTVLTSLFAIAMELFPLDAGGGAASAREDAPRTRVVRP